MVATAETASLAQPARMEPMASFLAKLDSMVERAAPVVSVVTVARAERFSVTAAPVEQAALEVLEEMAATAQLVAPLLWPVAPEVTVALAVKVASAAAVAPVDSAELQLPRMVSLDPMAMEGPLE